MIKLNMNSSSTIFRLFSERVNTPAMVDKSPQPGQHLISFLFLTVGESKSPLFITLQRFQVAPRHHVRELLMLPPLAQQVTPFRWTLDSGLDSWTRLWWLWTEMNIISASETVI